MWIRFLTISAAALMLAACDRNEEPQAPANAPSQSSSASSDPLVTGPKGPSEPLPKIDNETGADSGRASASTQPKGDLSKGEERKQMPLAGQANTHSSEALSEDKTNSGQEPPSSANGGQAAAPAAPGPMAQAGGDAQPAAGGQGTQPAAANGMDLIKKNNCVSCHAVDKKLVGPAYKEVAEKYKGDASAEAKLIEKVKKGGSGVWGPIPMPPHPNIPDDQLKAMVDWILAGAS